MWDWYSNKDDIIAYVKEKEQAFDMVNTAYSKLKDNPDLVICPNVRGKRHNTVTIPHWFQTDDLAKLGKDFAEYVYQEALPTKRLR